MDRIASDITNALLEHLPENKTVRTPDQLLTGGIPYLLVEEITANLTEQILEQAAFERSPWVDSNKYKERGVGEKIRQVLAEVIVLPAGRTEEVLLDAVTRCLKLSVQPAISIPELLFGGDDILTADEVEERSHRIKINRHLVQGLTRYLQKKEKDQISRSDAERVIKTIDKRLVEDYNPLNWADLLKPLFTIAGASVSAELLSTFFDEKGKTTEARKFELISEPVDETKFIEFMSSSDLLDVDGPDRGHTLFDVPEEAGPDETISGGEFAHEIPEEERDDEPGFESAGKVVPEEESDEEEETEIEDELKSGSDVTSEEIEMEETDESADESVWHETVEAEAVDETVDDDETETSLYQLFGDESIAGEEEEETDDPVFGEAFEPEEEKEPDPEEQLSIEPDEEQPGEEAEFHPEIKEEPEGSQEPLLAEEPDESEAEETSLYQLFGAEEEEEADSDDEETEGWVRFDAEAEDETAEAATNDEKFADEEEESPFIFDSDDEEGEDLEESIPYTLGREMEREEIDLNTLFRRSDESGEEEEQWPESEQKKEMYTEELPDEPEPDDEVNGDESRDHVETEDQTEDNTGVKPLLINEPDEPEEDSILSRFMFDDSVDDDSTEENPGRQATIYDELNLTKSEQKPGTIKNLFDEVEEETSAEPVSVKPTFDESDKTADISDEPNETELKSEPEPQIDSEDEPETDQVPALSEVEEPEEDADDVPMWRSFLDRSDIDDADEKENPEPEPLLFAEEEQEVETDEDGFIEEPIFDLTKEEPATEEIIAGLSEWLDDDRERFVDEIFSGSDAAYEEALVQINECDDWKNASKYIEKQIFTRNRVDLYDEVAVDFTDRLHTYFIEHKS